MHRGARQQRILLHLENYGQASVTDLAGLLEVSEDTIRRDLFGLAGQGLLQKTHGGAVALDVASLPRLARRRLLPEVKTALGKAVAAQISAGSTVMLDAGLTTLAVAMALDVPVTVITHSLDIAWTLAERTCVRVIVTGGLWDQRQRLLAGSGTTDVIRRYRADFAILGACAIHIEQGLTASEESDAEVKRAMLACSETHWLVSDHLKFGTFEPHFVAGLEEFDLLFTDCPLVPIESALIKQIIVPIPSSESIPSLTV